MAAARRLVARSGNFQSLRNRRFLVRVGVSSVRSANVQVLHLMTCGEGVEFFERRWLYVAAVLADATQQCFQGGAEGPISPASILTPWIAPLTLKPPQQRIVHYPPSLVKPGYKLF